MEDYGKLKSGTDIRGRAIASEGGPAVLTEKAVRALASAFAFWLSERTGKPRIKLAIGRDSRTTGPTFARAIIAALRKCGIEMYDCGLFSTPAAFMVTQFPSMSVDGSIMITASHHPSDINGLKFFTREGGVNSAELSEIIELANNGAHIKPCTLSSVVCRDFMRLYCDKLTDAIRKGTGVFLPLKGMRIVVDAGHGAGGFFAARVLAPLGADISASQFLEPDGTFPAHPPNPENAEAMESLKNRVLESGADLGIIFDADVDRCAIVSSDGTEINRCRLIALASAMILSEQPGATIVTDSVTTEGLRRFIESRGGVQKRFKRGYRNVIDEAKRLCDSGINAPLAIESSGHAAFKEHYFLDDGAYFIVKILIEYAKLRRSGSDLVDLIADLEVPVEEGDVRLNFVSADWRNVADKIITRLNAMSERMLKLSDDNYEGVRAYVSYADGYFIVRTSVHDPVLPIYMESNKIGGTAKIAKFLYSFLSGFIGLDCAPLYDYIEAHTFDSYSTDDYSAQDDYAEEPARDEPEGDYDENADIYSDEYAYDEGPSDEYAGEYAEEYDDEAGETDEYIDETGAYAPSDDIDIDYDKPIDESSF